MSSAVILFAVNYIWINTPVIPLVYETCSHVIQSSFSLYYCSQVSMLFLAWYESDLYVLVFIYIFPIA